MQVGRYGDVEVAFANQSMRDRVGDSQVGRGVPEKLELEDGYYATDGDSGNRHKGQQVSREEAGSRVGGGSPPQ